MNPYIPRDAIRGDLAKRVSVVDVTPDLAEKWLAHNTHNRHGRTAMQERYADDMTAGAWSFNGSSIVFADDGTLLDGQNRLHAVIASGCTVPFIIVVGAPMKVQDDIDTGSLRKFSDVLTLHGEVNTSVLAALIRFAHNWEIGERRGALFGGQLSVAAGLTFLDAHPEMREVSTWANNHRGELTPTLIGGLYWVFCQLDEAAESDAEMFFDRLVDGQGLLRGDPIYELRRVTSASTRGHSTRRTRAWAAAVTVKAWNAYRDGEQIGSLTWRSGGAHPEAFPEPR